MWAQAMLLRVNTDADAELARRPFHVVRDQKLGEGFVIPPTSGSSPGLVLRKALEREGGRTWAVRMHGHVSGGGRQCAGS